MSGPDPEQEDDTYLAAGENQGLRAEFSAAQIAQAFGVAVEHVGRAMAGEFGLAGDAPVDSRQAQHLSEVLLSDQPLDEREAALMRLGAFTPRPDQEYGLGEIPTGDESDRLAASPQKPPDELASRASSHAISQPSADEEG